MTKKYPDTTAITSMTKSAIKSAIDRVAQVRSSVQPTGFLSFAQFIRKTPDR